MVFFFSGPLLAMTLIAEGVASVRIHEASFRVDGLADLLFRQTYDIVMRRSPNVVRVNQHGAQVVRTADHTLDGVEIDQSGCFMVQTDSFHLT